MKSAILDAGNSQETHQILERMINQVGFATWHKSIGFGILCLHKVDLANVYILETVLMNLRA